MEMDKNWDERKITFKHKVSQGKHKTWKHWNMQNEREQYRMKKLNLFLVGV